MLKAVDSLRIHPRNKILLPDRYVLSKLSWQFTVADTSKTWISENLDDIVTKFVHQWLDLPISATISCIILSHINFGLALQLPSFKFQQCQTVLRSSLKQSHGKTINRLWKSTNCGTNIQYDIYKNIKQMLSTIRSDHIERLQSKLPSQGFLLSLLLDHSLKKLYSLWSTTQSKLPTKYFQFHNQISQ